MMRSSFGWLPSSRLELLFKFLGNLLISCINDDLSERTSGNGWSLNRLGCFVNFEGNLFVQKPVIPEFDVAERSQISGISPLYTANSVFVLKSVLLASVSSVFYWIVHCLVPFLALQEKLWVQGLLKTTKKARHLRISGA